MRKPNYKQRTINNIKSGVYNFQELKKQHAQLAELSLFESAADRTVYYINQEIFVNNINLFLENNKSWALDMTKADLLIMLCICSSFRPIQPFQLLTDIAIQCAKIEIGVKPDDIVEVATKQGKLKIIAVNGLGAQEMIMVKS